MNHAFTPSQVDNKVCARCKYTQIDHTDRATCEACGNTGVCEIIGTILMCEDCQAKEREAVANRIQAIATAAKMNEGVNLNRLPEAEREKLYGEAAELNILAKSMQIDNAIQLHTDIFNAKTVAIVELKKAIEADDSIENKHYKLAEVIGERFKHLTQVIFDARQKQVDAQNEQKAIQVYLNQLVDKLSKEEREKLKLHDIEYKPSDKPVKKPSAAKVKKFDKTEVREFAQKLTDELGFPVADSILQMICVSKNMSAEQAANHFRKNYKEAMSNNE